LTVGVNEQNGRRNEIWELPLGDGVEIDASARLLCERRRGQYAQVGEQEAGSEIHLALAKQLMTFGKIISQRWVTLRPNRTFKASSFDTARGMCGQPRTSE
jgi:hypothetical protein